MIVATLQRPSRIHLLYACAATAILGGLLWAGARASPELPPLVAAAPVVDRLLGHVAARDATSLARELPTDAFGARSAREVELLLAPVLHDRGWSELRVLRRELREGLSVTSVVAQLDLVLLPPGRGSLRARLGAHKGFAAVRLELNPIGGAWQVTAIAATPLELSPAFRL